MPWFFYAYADITRRKQMAKKTRENLQRKMDQVYEAAAKKEGNPVFLSRVKDEDFHGNIAYYSPNGIMLKDGRYVTRFWDGEKAYRMRAINNLPVETLQALFESDHGTNLQERYKEENEDYAYQNFLRKEDSEDPNLVNPMDAQAYRTNLGDPARVVLERLCPASPPRINPVGVIGMVGSRYDAPTVRCLKQMAGDIIDNLSETERKDFFMIFCSDLSQTEIAAMEKVSTPMITKRKKNLIRKISAIFRDKGYTPITKEQAKDEAKQRASYAQHYESASTALRKIYNPSLSEKKGYEERDNTEVLDAISGLETA